MSLKLNLGCGLDIRKDFENFDIKKFGNNTVGDINKGLPYENNSFEYIFASHFFEHIEDRFIVFKECLRVLKVNGCLEFVLPHYTNPLAFDLTHYHYFSWSAFYHAFSKNRYEKHIYLFGSWVLLDSFIELPHRNNFLFKFFEKLINRNDYSRLFYEKFVCGIIPAFQFRVVLKKLEGLRN